MISCPLAPQAREQYTDPNAATKDPQMALIAFMAFLGAVVKSDVHSVLRKLPQDQWTGYHVWMTMESVMEGEDRKEAFVGLADSSLKQLWKNHDMTILQLRSNLRRIFALYKAGDRELSDKEKMKVFCCKAKSDSDFSSTAERLLVDINQGTIKSFNAVFKDLKGHEDELRVADAQGDTVPELDSRKGICRAPASNLNSSGGGTTFASVVQEFQVPNGLWADANSKQHLYFIKWKKFLTTATSFRDALSLKPPMDEEVSQYEAKGKKRRSASGDGPKSNKKNRKARRSKKAKDDKDNDELSSADSQHYDPSSSSLSIPALASGETRVSPYLKDFPALRVLMFWEPTSMMIPIRSASDRKTPQAPSAPGKLAIRSGRSGNPLGEDLLIDEIDYSYRPPPTTCLSTKSDCFRRVFKALRRIRDHGSRFVSCSASKLRRSASQRSP